MFDHTFSICAYKQSPYLEKCIKSIMRQTIKTNVIMVTSTPNEYIKKLASKYRIPLYVRDGASDIRDDWNFAYDKADTKWVTVAHQDDLYGKRYVEEISSKIDSVYKKAFRNDADVKKYKDILAVLTDYKPIKNNQIGKRDINSRIRRFLRIPLKSDRLAGKTFWKKAVISLGNSICCPTVTYNKEILGESFFTSELKFNIDWDTFYKLAELKGIFAYVDKPLTFYRVHDDATSKEFIENHLREKDDIYMFSKFWPKWIVKIIMVFYKKAYDTYG